MTVCLNFRHCVFCIAAGSRLLVMGDGPISGGFLTAPGHTLPIHLESAVFVFHMNGVT
jgi:hypothetical protein